MAPQFHGFVEGHDIAAGTTDVIVTDGFTGNVALKTAEGTAKLVLQLLRQVFTRRCRPGWATCWRARSWTGCASWSTRGATTAPSWSG